MKPAAFDYVRPDSVDEALEVLAASGDEARVLAGGQSLTAMLNMRLANPSVLIDIARIQDLKNISLVDGMIEVGAAVTQAALLAWPDLVKHQPLLAQILPNVCHYQTRQRGTVCGSLAHAEPSAELPLALATLQGEVVVQGKRGRRVLSAADFQTGMMTTDVAADEMITACRFPVADAQSRSLFHEVSQRHGDFALVALAAVSTAQGVRLGVGGVAEIPRIVDLPLLQGEAVEATLNDLAWELDGVDDPHASARYRRELVRRIGKKIINEVSHATS